MKKKVTAADEGDVLEQGDIFFFYRPRIGVEIRDDEEDLERLFIILHPSGESLYREILLGKRRQPGPKDRGRFWGLSYRVLRSPAEVGKALEEQRYATRNRGERARPAARPAGEGVYALVKHGDHTHLAYALELPNREGEVQRELEIEDEADFIVAIKNPGHAGGLPAYPRRLALRFRGRPWIPVDPVDYLDVEGTELAFLATRKDLSRELGIAFERGRENRRSAEISRALKLQRIGAPVRPLFDGVWA